MTDRPEPTPREGGLGTMRVRSSGSRTRSTDRPEGLSAEEKRRYNEHWGLAPDACNCHHGSARYCPVHTQTDYDAARDSRPVAAETFWLAERGKSMKQVPTVWWTGDADDPEYGWTTDANRAMRFATREAAAAYIEARSPIPGNRDRWATAV